MSIHIFKTQNIPRIHTWKRMEVYVSPKPMEDYAQGCRRAYKGGEVVAEDEGWIRRRKR